MGARLKAAEAREIRLEKKVEELRERIVNLTGERDEACARLLTSHKISSTQDRTLLRLLAAEKKLAAIDAVQHPNPGPHLHFERDTFESRITWDSPDVISGLFYGAISNRETGRRINVGGPNRHAVIQTLRRLDAQETERANAKLKVKVTAVADILLAEIDRHIDRTANQVAKKQEEQIEDSLMALGWQPPMFSSAAERRANLLKLNQREAERRLHYRYGYPMVSDRSIFKASF